MKQANLLHGFIKTSVFAFFFPIFHSVLGTSGAIGVNIMIIIIACSILLANFNYDMQKEIDTAYRTPLGCFLLIFVIFLLQIPISMSLGALLNDFPIIVRDFYEIHRPILYTLIFCLAYFSVGTHKDLYKTNRIFIYLFVGMLILGINQSFRVSDEITEVYTKHHNAMTRRLTAPFINPYDYAFIMIFFIFYFLFKFFYENWKYIFLVALAIILFIQTQSRSMAIGLLFGIGLVLPMFMFFVNIRPLSRYRLSSSMLKYVILSASGLIIFFALLGFLLTNFSYLTKSFVTIIESRSFGSLDGATSTRIEQLNYALELALKNPWTLMFGNGSAKEHMEFVESMYTYYLFRYGVFGLVLYFLAPLLLGIKYATRSLSLIKQTDPLFPFFAALLIWLICLPVCSIGNNLTEQVRVSFFYYSCLGLLARSVSILNLKSDSIN